jgi:hypothetical protein
MPPWLIRHGSKFKLIQTPNSKCFNVFCITELSRIRYCMRTPQHVGFWNSVAAFVNVNGRDRVLNPGPLSRRPDKSPTTPRSDTQFNISITILWNSPKKMYLSHSGKWMQVAFSLSHSCTFTCTTPVKPYKFLSFPGVI